MTEMRSFLPELECLVVLSLRTTLCTRRRLNCLHIIQVSIGNFQHYKGLRLSPVLTLDFYFLSLSLTVQAEIGRLDPYGNAFGTGMLGRMSDALTSKSYSVNSFSIDANLVALQGHNLNAAKSSVNSATGFKHFNPSAPKGNITKNVLLLNGDEGEHNGLLSQFWSSSLVSRKIAFNCFFF
jgi:hypothetical protein